MKAARSLLFALLAVAFLVTAAQAQEKGKTVTLKGKITCAKCDLKVANSCHTVIVVDRKGKDVVYYLDKNSPGYTHKEVCQSAKEGTVTGTTHMKGNKHYIKATKVTFND
jgi:hypothetical protein